MGAGYAVGMTCRVLIDAAQANRVDGKPLSNLEKGWWCTLGTFFIGMAFEAAQGFSDGGADPNDALAAGIGGASAGLLRIAIDF